MFVPALAAAVVWLASVQGEEDVEGCAAREQGDPLAFWVGEWNVYFKDEKVGFNRIERVLGGCAIIEHWRDTTGHEGKSFFYYSPVEATWKQVWVTDTPWQRSGTKEKKLVETLPGGAVKFQGQLLTPGPTILDRTTLTPLPDGRLRQVIEQSPDGKTWKPVVDLIHIRAAASQ